MDDRDAIRDVMARYNLAGDRGDVAALAALFASNGILRLGGEESRGRAAIVARLSGGTQNPALRVTRHHLTTMLIEIDGAQATGRTYFQVLTNIGADHHGVYVDRFEKADGAWWIAEREVRIDWQAAGSLFPPLHVRGRPPGA